MRMLLVLLAVVFSLGAYFSGDGPQPDFEKPGCQNEKCGCDSYFKPRWSAQDLAAAELPAR